MKCNNAAAAAIVFVSDNSRRISGLLFTHLFSLSFNDFS